MRVIIIAVTFLFLSAVSFADDLKDVYVKGYGATYQEQLNNAFETAIHQVIGVGISANTSIRNGELVDDKVHTRTSGYITKYEIIEQNKEYIYIKATVKEGSDPQKWIKHDLERAKLNQEIEENKKAIHAEMLEFFKAQGLE